MLLEENLDPLFLLKNKKKTLTNSIDHCLDSTLYRAIYRCIVIHQRQYIDTSTHCIVASILPVYVQSITISSQASQSTCYACRLIWVKIEQAQDFVGVCKSLS